MRWHGNPFNSEGRVMMLLTIGPVAGILIGIPALFGVGVTSQPPVDTYRPLPDSITSQHR